jgi:hypothetical protein
LDMCENGGKSDVWLGFINVYYSPYWLWGWTNQVEIQ